MASIRTRNQELLAQAQRRSRDLSTVRAKAVARKKEHPYSSPGQQAWLDAVVANVDRQQEVLNQEIALRMQLDGAYAAAATKSSSPAHLDGDAAVKQALQALKTHRAAHQSEYPKGSLAAGCVPCAQESLAEIKPWVGRTSPEALVRVNRELGTRIDFGALSQFEGGQWRKPYMPCSGDLVAARSGVTVATGFDVGQVTAAQVEAMDLPSHTKAKLKKFADKNYKGQPCADARAALDKLGRDEFSQAEVDAIDYSVKKQHLAAAQSDWDRTVPEGQPKFSELTSAQQTVLFSRTFHQGTKMPKTAEAQKFYGAAQKGDWVRAEQLLRGYPVKPDWYRRRVGEEADLLKSERLGKK